MRAEVDLPTGVNPGDLAEDSAVLEAQTVPDDTEPVPFKFNTDFRPKGPQGNQEGAAGRQRSRMRHLENVGRGILMNEAISGRIVMITPDNGGFKFELVTAAQPIPEREMIPSSEVDLSGVFTPFEPTGKSFTIKVNNKNNV